MSSPSGLTNVRRSWLERVLEIVGELGAHHDLNATLDFIARATVEQLEFGAAAINVTTPDGQVRVEAVAGPPELGELLGQSSPLSHWLDLLAAAESWGTLRYFGHDRDQALAERMANWTWSPDSPPSDDPDTWHPEDWLLAPFYDGEGKLIGALSVDQPRSGRRPDLEQRTALELFAAQAGRAVLKAGERARAQQRRQQAEELWQLTFARSPIGAALIDPIGRMVQINDGLVRILGFPQERLIGGRLDDFTHPDDRGIDDHLVDDLFTGDADGFEIEKRYLHADGHQVWGLLHVGAIRDDRGEVHLMVGQVNDITDRKRAEAELAHRATHDALTNLPNRLLLEERLGSYLRAGQPAGVLFCDLDRFKIVNDSLGHEAGDELLIAVAQRLADALPPSFTLGRLGGDEFVVIAPHERDLGRLRSIGARLIDALEAPMTIRGHQHTVSVSVGVVVSGPAHAHPDEVLREADQALLRAKREGRSRVEVYDPDQDRPATVDDLEFESTLRSALSRSDGLVPYFQPILGIASNTTVGYEALVRWQHPERGFIEPAEFIPMAEAAGLIVPLGWWMLDASARAAATLPSGGQRWVAVNASGSQLGRGELMPAVRRALEVYQLTPDQLHLEITETALVSASDAAIDEVCEVAAMGVPIALDDFGTGYSSLSLLRDLPVSTVKIDRSFVTPIAHDNTAIAITRSLVTLCRDLGITTVAEGVETAEQLAALRSLGCTHAQGYLIGAPAPLGPQQQVSSLDAHRRRTAS
ncbi:MAG: EAL domain-containing protein [Actinobacteria bacterium]|nr:EAL domain-containing protein [Actinomycetota bacterium]